MGCCEHAFMKIRTLLKLRHCVPHVEGTWFRVVTWFEGLSGKLALGAIPPLGQCRVMPLSLPHDTVIHVNFSDVKGKFYKSLQRLG